MSSEDIKLIIEEYNASKKPPKHEVFTQIIAPIITAISVAILFYIASIFTDFADKVNNTEQRIDNLIDLNAYQSLMIDHNFKVVNKTKEELNTIYIPEMVFTRGVKPDKTKKQ